MDSLSDEHRKIFMSTLDDSIEWLNQTVKSETDNLLKKMEETGKVKVINPDVDPFRKIAQPIVKKFAAEKCRPDILDEIAKYAE